MKSLRKKKLRLKRKLNNMKEVPEIGTFFILNFT